MASTQWVLATGADDVKVWRSAGASGPEELPSPQIVRARSGQPVRCVRFDKTGQLLGSCGDDGCVHIASVASGGQDTVTLQPDDSFAPATCFSFSSGSGYLSSGAADGIIRVWDTKQRRVLQRFDDHQRRAITCMSFTSNDAHLASGNEAGDVLIHGLVTQNLTARLPAQAVGAAASPVNHLEYSRLRKSFLGTAYDDGSVFVWDINATEKPHAAFPSQHKAACTGIAFSPVNHVLFASGSMDGNIIFYDVAQRKIVKSMPTGSPITCMSFHDDGVTVAVGKASGDVAIYDLRSARGNKPLVVLPHAHDPAFAPTGVQSIHFQRIRRSSRSAKSGADTSSTGRSPSGLSESGASVASSTGMAIPSAAATARHDASARSSLRSSAVSESSSLTGSMGGVSAANTADVAPPVFSPGPSTVQRDAASGSAHDATSGSALAPVSTPQAALSSQSQTPQSVARQQKTEAFQAKTNALLAKLDRMSPAGVQHRQPATEDNEEGYGGIEENRIGSGTAERSINSAVPPELAPGLAQLRARQSGAGLPAAPADLETDLSRRPSQYDAAQENQHDQDRKEFPSRAARMSPPAASSAANAVSVPPSLTTTTGIDAVDARPAMLSPAAQSAPAQRLQFSSSARPSASNSGTERVKTAWGSEEHTSVSAAASGPYRSGRDMSTHPHGSGIDPPAVLASTLPESQSQRAPIDQDGGARGPAPSSTQDATLQVRKTPAGAPYNTHVGIYRHEQ